MKIALISDIHSNLEALEATLQDLQNRDVGCILCLGDVVGYNANPAECITLLRGHNVLCVAGNHDRAVARQIAVTDFCYTASRAVVWTRRHLDADALAFLSALPTDLSIPGMLVAVHGALHPNTGRETVRLDNDEKRRLSLDALALHPSGARVCAFGHTHQLGIYELRAGVLRELTGDQIFLRQDGWYLINPGTVGQPRTSEMSATYLIFDAVRNEITTHRVAYDNVTPFSKTRRAGLVPTWTTLPPLFLEMWKWLPKPIRKTLKWSMGKLNL
jgi:predicted phosphodiesterase